MLDGVSHYENKENRVSVGVIKNPLIFSLLSQILTYIFLSPVAPILICMNPYK